MAAAERKEEGEDVAYHPGVGSQEQAHVEEGVLYQPLEEAGERQAKAGAGGVIPDAKGGPGAVLGRDAGPEVGGVAQPCETHSRVQVCKRYVGWLSDGLSWLKHAGGNLLRKGVKVLHWIIDLRSKSKGFVGPYSGGSVASNCEVVGFTAAFASPFVPVASGFAKGVATLFGGGLLGSCS